MSIMEKSDKSEFCICYFDNEISGDRKRRFPGDLPHIALLMFSNLDYRSTFVS